MSRTCPETRVDLKRRGGMTSQTTKRGPKVLKTGLSKQTYLVNNWVQKTFPSRDVLIILRSEEGTALHSFESSILIRSC